MYHALILGRISLGRLSALDTEVREEVRKWLCLPKDTPLGFFHASIKDGGLGIPALNILIPSIMCSRLERLQNSSLPVAREAFLTTRVQRRIRWARKVLSTQGLPGQPTTAARHGYWARKLHDSVDGRDLREASHCKASTSWVSRAQGIPGRDYLQHIHTRINTLPTRMRVSRGVQRLLRDPHCRAGCPATETAAHIIQCCWRTHGGRVKRHDAIVNTLATKLESKGWRVITEPRIQTSSGLQKPDIIAGRDQIAVVIDAQVVSGATQLNKAHRAKAQKYRSDEMSSLVAKRLGTAPEETSYTSCTLSWRGIWSKASARDLEGLGLSSNFLTSLTTRVLQGSHTNWSRFNRMTCVSGGYVANRVGVG